MKNLSLLFIAAAAALTPAAASAEEYPQITDGMSLTVTANMPVYEYVPAEDGVLYIATNSFSQFADASGSTVLYTAPTHTLDEGVPLLSSMMDYLKGWTYLYKVTKDTPYYFYLDFLDVGNDDPIFTFTLTPGDLEPAVNSVYPTPSTTTPYSINSYPEVMIDFNYMGVRIEGATLSYTDNAGEEQQIALSYKIIDTGNSERFDIDVKSGIIAVKSNMEDGSIFTVTVKGANLDGTPVTGRYITDGDIVLRYKYQHFTSVVDIKYPNPILSYWPIDSEEGIITVEFDGPLAPLGDDEDVSLFIFAGLQPDGPDWPELPGAPVTVEGSKVTIDLRGVKRETDKDVVTITLNGIKDVNGRSVDYNGGSLIGFYNIPYVLLEKIDIFYMFTPDEGESLTDAETLELWLGSDIKGHLEITGFTFTVGEDSETVAIDDVTITPDPYDATATIYEIPVPAMARVAGIVTLAADIESLDGNEYAITASFENDVTPGDSGVEAVEAAPSAETIYSLQGIRLDRKAGELPAGIYIVNGRKMVVR